MFFRFAPMGKVEKTRFERNWTTFVNPAFSAAWKSPPKMVAWNRNCKIRSQGCFSVSPRWGKLKKRIWNAIGRTLPHRGASKNTLGIEFLQFRFHAPFWVGFSKQRKKPDWRRSSNCVQNAFFQLSPSGRNGKTPLGSNFTISVSCHHFGWAFPSSGKSRIDEGRPIAFKTRFFNFPHRGETKKHPWDRILQFRVFMPPFWVGFSKQRKKPDETKVVQLRPKTCFFVSPRWGKLKKCVLNAIGRPSSIRLFPLLGKAHPKWWHETEIVKFDPKGVFPFRPDGESWENAFWTQLDDLRQSGFFRCLEKPTQNGGMKPKL